MKSAVLLLLITLLSLSCLKPKPVEKTILDYQKQIQHIIKFSETKNYNKNIAFMIDYSLHSGLNRFYVINLKTKKFITKGLVCHGDCKGENNGKYAKKFSNKNDSHCTSLGMAVVEERAYSNWGKHFKYWLNGLEKSNNKMRKRVVVLHAWSGVANKEIYPKSLATSFGCPTVSIAFLDQLDVILKKNKKVLLYCF